MIRSIWTDPPVAAVFREDEPITVDRAEAALHRADVDKPVIVVWPFEFVEFSCRCEVRREVCRVGDLPNDDMAHSETRAGRDITTKRPLRSP